MPHCRSGIRAEPSAFLVPFTKLDININMGRGLDVNIRHRHKPRHIHSKCGLRHRCYSAEDFMGKMRKIGEASTSGSMGCVITNKMAEKWLVAAHLEMTKQEDWIRKLKFRGSDGTFKAEL